MLLLSYFLLLNVVNHVYCTLTPTSDTPLTIVSTSSGPIQGRLVEYIGVKVYEFLGVPYAKPPVGPLRLQSPQKVDPWNKTKLTVNYGASCPQKSGNRNVKETSEDCLFLNVYVTKMTFNLTEFRKRPVLFWIHGGSLTRGSGNQFYPGIPLVSSQDVILVTHNYRLNAFGFIYFGPTESRIPSNIGLRDQLEALKWVKDNIAQFGGDPNQVTIFGESSGSMSVSAHLLSPLSKGLFKRAILESGTIYLPVDDPSFFIRNAWTFYNRTTCRSKVDDILGCLQSLQESEIVYSQSDGVIRFRWVFGDDFLPYTPAEAFSRGLYDSSVDLLIGAEKNESSIFLPSINPQLFDPLTPGPIDYQTTKNYLLLAFNPEALDYYSDLYLGPPTDNSTRLISGLERAYSDYILLCPTYMFGLEFGSRSTSQGGNVYAYYHTQKSRNPVSPECDTSPWMGTCHANDIPFVYGLPLFTNQNSVQKKIEIELSLEMMKIWAHFAEFSKPPSVGGTEWKTLNQDGSAMIMNVADFGKVDRNRIELCKKEWNNFTLHGSFEFFYLLGSA